MPSSKVTFAKLIGTVDYQTACIGKWDVSNNIPIVDRMPNAKGFDYYFGAFGANDGGKVKFHEKNETAGESLDMASLTRMYTSKAIHYLKKQRDPSHLFILYLARAMMHAVVDASPKFKGTSKSGLFGDAVEEFDFETGRLLDTLDALSLRDNTLVIYASDYSPH